MKDPLRRAFRFGLSILAATLLVAPLPAAAPVQAAQVPPSAPPRAVEQAAPNVSAPNAAVIEGATGEVLWEVGGRTRVAMASTTKVMTAILAIERGDLGARVTSGVDGPRMAIENGSSILGLVPGDWLTMEDMLYGLMLVSGNEVAIAIAEHIAGSEQQFVHLMNEKASALGLKDTHFENSHGLDGPTHYSTAVDMARLGRYAMQNQTFARIVGTTHKILSGSRTFEVYQQNRIVGDYPGGDGIKTGYTEEAGQALVASATRDGRRVIIAFMRSVQRNVDAERLLNYGFAVRPPAQSNPVVQPVAAPVGPSGPEWDIPNGRFYTQTNGQAAGSSKLGFAVIDDGAAKFWTEFKRYGGIEGLGYPVSQRFMADGFLSQAFQRGIMQWRPEVSQAYLVNVFDRLHELGRDDWLFEKYQTPPPVNWASDNNKTWDEIYRSHMALLDDYPAFKARFDATPGIPYVAHGLPMAPVKDMGNVLVLRLQRSVFQYWKVNTPWAKAGEVTVALGGDIAKDAGLLPAAAIEAAAAPMSGTAPIATQVPVASATPVVTTPVVTTTPVPSATATPSAVASPTPAATPVAAITPRPANTTLVDVALDPAHSIGDVGSSAEGVAEYLINLRVARAAQKQLEAAGYTVRLTRNDEKPVSAFNDPDFTVRARKEQEARIAAGLPARIFVTIRANGFYDTEVGGTETFYNAEFGGADGGRLASSILKSLLSDIKGANGPAVDRGVKEDALAGKPFGGFFGLAGKTPMVVAATLFVTNPADRAFMSRPDGPEILGRAIANGIVAYLTGRA